VKFSRDGRDGSLVIDDFEILPLSSSGQSRSVEVVAPYYVGGMPRDVASNAAHNLQVYTHTLLHVQALLPLTSAVKNDSKPRPMTRPSRSKPGPRLSS